MSVYGSFIKYVTREKGVCGQPGIISSVTHSEKGQSGAWRGALAVNIKSVTRQNPEMSSVTEGEKGRGMNFA